MGIALFTYPSMGFRDLRFDIKEMIDSKVKTKGISKGTPYPNTVTNGHRKILSR
jgi:hypothetical protein